MVEWVSYIHLVQGSNPCAPIAGEWNGITIPGPYPVNRVGNAKKVYYRFTCQAIDEGG